VNVALSGQTLKSRGTIGNDIVVTNMAERRKIFRIERTAGMRLLEDIADVQAPLWHAELTQELAALQAAVTALSAQQSGKADAAPNAETARLKSELDLIAGAISGSAPARADGNPAPAQVPAAPMTRIAHELAAVVDSAEQATQKILAAAEEIDQIANNLSASLRGSIEQGSAQDIRDLVIRIFEACNFQDLAGQRVAKVMATMKFVEDHIARVLDEIKNAPAITRRDGNQHLHGPRLAIDRGHASQGDVDAMFGL
jgi:chemotaxis protein CheZ